MFFLYYNFLSLSLCFFFLLFLDTEIFGNINAELSPSRVTDIKTASLWVYTHRNTELVCVLQNDKQKYNTKNACIFPVGWKSRWVVHISIKIMQSVMVWLSLCARVTVSFPSINPALWCLFLASSLLDFSIRKIHFHGRCNTLGCISS